MIPGISLHLMTRNPPMDRLAALIAFVQPYVRETVIVNTGMPDEDRATIASWHRQIGIDSDVHIVDAEFTDFASTRNKGLERHRCEWTMHLDTDEFPSAGMMAHIVWATSPAGQRSNPNAVGYLYFTYGWEDGRYYESVAHDWHTRLFRTEGSYYYRALHELVAIGGVAETEMRRSAKLPAAPTSAFLIHSYRPDRTGAKAALYTALASSETGL